MHLPSLLTLAQWAGVAMPTLYAGITFQYSLTTSLLASTTPSPDSKLLATQWLALYQQGPRWVPPLIHTGALANLYLAVAHPGLGPYARYLYAAAAALTLAVLPVTFLYFEPGVNGACKWKADIVLREAGGAGLLARKRGLPVSVVRHSASERSKRWAEGSEMGELVRAWADRNHGRWVLGVVAGAVSFAASRAM